MRTLIICGLLGLLPLSALADQTPPLVPGLPLKAVGGNETPPGSTPSARTPTASPNASLREAEALKAMVDTVRHKVGPSDQVAPPPPSITARPGVNEVIPIGINRINRIRTTFAAPEVKTVADATISTEGSIVYVAASSAEPVALFVLDKGAPERALSLTLLPRDLPPVDIEVKLEGDDLVQRPIVRPEAQAWETEQPYVETISDVMKALALGQVPDGYGLSERPAAADLPRCRWPGVTITAGQRLDGANLIAVVARVSNRSAQHVVLDESQCEDDDVLAVAAWPQVELAPGEQTELFVVRRRADDAAPARQRPSTLTAGAP